MSTSLTMTDTIEEMIELRDHLSELASGYLERYGRDDIYYSLINTIENVTDKIGTTDRQDS
jgi:hypothetical protein